MSSSAACNEGNKAPLFPTEDLPLIQSEDNDNETHGHATFQETIINLMKTCAGTGTLALPYAARQGGLILNVFGLFCIAGWNIFSVQRLVECLKYLDKSRNPPAGTSTFGKVAWYAFGNKGLMALDLMMLILLCGIIVAYVGKDFTLVLHLSPQPSNH